jgi:hypothetical protein
MRRVWAGSALAVLSVVILPASASAATTFGADMTQTPVLSSCANEITGDVKNQAGEPVTGTPISGVLTSVSIKTQGAGGEGLIRVVRQIGPPQAPGNYDFLNVGPDIPVTVTEDMSAQGHITDVPTRQPIEAGDRLSIYFPDDGSCAIKSAWDDGGTTPVCAVLPSAAGPAGHTPGVTLTFAGSTCNSPQMLSGTVEPDCDADGFGDETQDTNGAVCTPPAPPSTQPPVTPVKKKKKCKKAKGKGKGKAAPAPKKKCRKGKGKK